MLRRDLLALTTLPFLQNVLAANTGYPDRLIKLICGFPGGPADAVARLVAKKLNDSLGQPCIVETKPGAGGVTAASFVAKAPPDGYTLLQTTSSTHLYQPTIKKSLPYDVREDFTPIMLAGQSTNAIIVAADSPIRTVNDLIKLAKKEPGAVSYGSAGTGTAMHIAGEIFGECVGAKLLHVPYKGAAAATTDLIGGSVQVMFDSPTNANAFIRAGRLRALAVMSGKRWSTLADVPTVVELGWPDMQTHTWHALFGPSGMSDVALKRITGALSGFARDPEVIAFFQTAGIPLVPIFGKDFAVLMDSQLASLEKSVKKANIAPID